MDSRGEHVRSVGVPQIVEPDTGQGGFADRIGKLVREAIRLDAFAGSGGANQRVISQPNAELQQFLGLLQSQGLQFSDDRLRLGNVAAPAAFRLFVAHAGFSDRSRPCRLCQAALERDVPKSSRVKRTA